MKNFKFAARHMLSICCIILILNCCMVSASASNTDVFSLSDEEKAYIASLGTIKVMADENFRPLSSYNRTKESYQGSGVELFEGFAQKTGLSYTYVRKNDITTRSEQVSMILDQKIDVLFPYDLGFPLLENTVYTSPVMQDHYVLITTDSRKDLKIESIASISDLRIGICENASVIPALRDYLPSENLITYPADASLYMALNIGKLDYILQRSSTFQEDYYQKELFGLSVVYDAPELSTSYGYLFSSSNLLPLANLFNRYMETVSLPQLMSENTIGSGILVDRYMRVSSERLSIIVIVSVSFWLLIFLLYRMLHLSGQKKMLSMQALMYEEAFLKAQIKPHFLYNALGSIMDMCYVDGDAAGNLLGSLTNYLRIIYNTDGKNSYIPLERELELVQSYVKIEQARFGERLHMEYDIDPLCLQYYTQPLVIQPLVENAIRHGALSRTFGGIVRLSIRSLGSCLMITVWDNGAGLSACNFEKILKKRESSNSGIGLANINRRIARFGKRGGLSLQSETGAFTQITLMMPLMSIRDIKEEASCSEPSS